MSVHGSVKQFLLHPWPKISSVFDYIALCNQMTIKKGEKEGHHQVGILSS